MLDPTDTRFFKTLQELIDRQNPACIPLGNAVDRALQSGDPMDMLAAREALHTLDDAAREPLLRQVHHRMSTDLSAIWDALPAAPGPQKPN